MPWQKLITIAACAAVATSLGSATQADIQMRDSAVHARFDLTDPRGEPFPSDRFTEFDASNLTGAVSTSQYLTAARTQTTVKTS